MRDNTSIYICVTIFIFMIVAMVIAGSTYSWDYWYVYSPLMFGFIFFIFCILYSVMLAAEPAPQRRPPRQIRTVQVITTETVNRTFQMEPVVPASLPTNLPGYDAPPKYTDVVKDNEVRNVGNVENVNSVRNEGNDAGNIDT